MSSQIDEIREGFHTLANQLNNISIQAGTTVEMVNFKDIDNMDEKGLREEYRKALAVLSSSVDSVIKAGETISILKKKIYGLLDIKTK